MTHWITGDLESRVAGLQPGLLAPRGVGTEREDESSGAGSLSGGGSWKHRARDDDGPLRAGVPVGIALIAEDGPVVSPVGSAVIVDSLESQAVAEGAVRIVRVHGNGCLHLVPLCVKGAVSAPLIVRRRLSPSRSF